MVSNGKGNDRLTYRKKERFLLYQRDSVKRDQNDDKHGKQTTQYHQQSREATAWGSVNNYKNRSLVYLKSCWVENNCVVRTPNSGGGRSRSAWDMCFISGHFHENIKYGGWNKWMEKYCCFDQGSPTSSGQGTMPSPVNYEGDRSPENFFSSLEIELGSCARTFTKPV